MAELSFVGKSVPKVDARAKVLGKTKYVSEEGIGIPGLLYGKVLFSPHAHARIAKIDTSKAAGLKGVRAVLTGRDAPPNRVGLLIDDRHVLCREVVRFVGDPVACVAADSAEIAEEAVRLIDVEYEILPAVFDAELAMAADCPVIIHPDLPTYNRPMYAYMGDDLPGPNVHTHHKIRKGDVDRAFGEADFIVENRFECDRITHCQMELYNSVCYPETDATLTVWTSARLRETHDPLLQMFGFSPSQLRTRTSYQGGMFGMLGRPERFTILLAQKTADRVKMVYSREENFIEGLNRLAEIVYVKDGLKKDGTIIAREVKGIVNTGAYTHHGPLVLRNGAFHASQYRLPNYRWDAYGIYTNTPACGPLRGFGSAEVLWATEQQMDLDAHAVGMDPIEFRLMNTPDEGERDVRGTLSELHRGETLPQDSGRLDRMGQTFCPAERESYQARKGHLPRQQVLHGRYGFRRDPGNEERWTARDHAWRRRLRPGSEHGSHPDRRRAILSADGEDQDHLGRQRTDPV